MPFRHGPSGERAAAAELWRETVEVAFPKLHSRAFGALATLTPDIAKDAKPMRLAIASERTPTMTSSVTHFEIYAEAPAKLAEFYGTLLGWQIDKAPGIDYWRIETGAGEAKGIGGGILFRPIPGPRSWVHYVHVESLDRHPRADRRARRFRGPTEGRGAEGGVVRGRGRPRGQHLRHLASRPAGDADARTRSLSRRQQPKPRRGERSCVTPTTRCIPRTCNR